VRRNAVLQPGGACLRLPHASAIPDPRHVSGVASSSTYGSGTGDADAPSEQDDPDITRTATSLPPGSRVLVELRSGWFPGVVLGHRAGFEDEDFQRLDVALDDGRTVRGAHPDCVIEVARG